MTKQTYRLCVGTLLTSATLCLVLMLSTESFQNNQSRYVASFIAGLFGFTAIETLRYRVD
jgi:hypothetical protein